MHDPFLGVAMLTSFPFQGLGRATVPLAWMVIRVGVVVRGPDAVWVDRPVVCIRDGAVRPGRYLDQRPAAAPPGGDDGPSAHDFLSATIGQPFVDQVIRRYVEKVDGMPLERITAMRAAKLMYEQAAAQGFWYAAGGIGQLMGAMAAEIRERGGQVVTGTRVGRIRTSHGRVLGVDAQHDDVPVTIDAPRLVAGLPGALVAELVDPAPPEGVIPALAPRAAALVYLLVDQDRLTDHAWIQIDDPRVPFARMSEAKNWSARLVPGGQTVIGCECYCAPSTADPAWGLDDAALSEACAAALRGPLRLVDDGTPITPLQVVRIPRAWSLVEADQLDLAAAPYQWLAEIQGLTVAQGGDVIQAIAAGEHCAG